MGKLDGRGDLAAAQVAFFAPALVIAVFIVVRHGFSRRTGWIYLALLSILRIIGASCVLYMQTQNDDSLGLLETAAITSAVGTAPLLLGLQGFMSRVSMGMKGRGIPDIAFRAIQLLATIGLILAIVGGVKESESPLLHPNPTGKSLMEAASILFLVIYIMLVGIVVITFTRKSEVLSGELKLVLAGLAGLPFLLVRVLFTVIVAFASPTSIFYFREPNIWAEAFMQFLMEAIVVTIFATAGILTPKAAPEPRTMPPASHQQSGGYYQKADSTDIEMDAGRTPPPPPPQQQQQARFQQPRNIGDYRPSRLIRNAISNR